MNSRIIGDCGEPGKEKEMSVMKTISAVILGGLILIMATTTWADDDVFDSSSPIDAHVAGGDDEQSSGDADGDSDSGGKLKLGGPLLLSRFTMQAGGAITITPGVYIPKEGDSAGGGWFHFNPELGFFVIDKLEILFAFSLGLPFGDGLAAEDADVGFGIGARYFIDFDALALYFGGTLGASFQIPDSRDLNVRKYFDINLMVGVLIALNRHVGLDLGMRFNSAILLGDYPSQPGAASELTFPIGYLGVQGFFNLFTGE